jgi:hypothetical protein
LNRLDYLPLDVTIAEQIQPAMADNHSVKQYLVRRLAAAWSFNFDLQPAAEWFYQSRYIGLTGYAELDKPFAVVERSGIVAPDRYRVFEDPVYFQNYIGLYGRLSF